MHTKCACQFGQHSTAHKPAVFSWDKQVVPVHQQATLWVVCTTWFDPEGPYQAEMLYVVTLVRLLELLRKAVLMRFIGYLRVALTTMLIQFTTFAYVLVETPRGEPRAETRTHIVSKATLHQYPRRTRASAYSPLNSKQRAHAILTRVRRQLASNGFGGCESAARDSLFLYLFCQLSKMQTSNVFKTRHCPGSLAWSL